MCWSSEHGAIGAAPEQLLTEFATVSDEKSVRSYEYENILNIPQYTKKGGAYFHQRKTAKIWIEVEDDEKNRLKS